jgi:hypothetical protein
MAMSNILDTMIRYDLYIASATRAAAQARAARLALAHQNRQRLWVSAREQKVSHPTLADVDRGDTLNLLAERIAATQIPYSAQRSTGINLAGETLDLLPLYHAASGTVISIARLNPREGWPLLLRESRFSAARRKYQEAVETALGQISTTKLTLSAITDVAEAVANLRRELAGCDPSTVEATDRRVAGEFLDRLERSISTLGQPASERILVEIMRAGTTSVADLLDFMNRHNLRFGRAEAPAERALHAELRQLLGKHLAKLSSEGQ